MGWSVIAILGQSHHVCVGGGGSGIAEDLVIFSLVPRFSDTMELFWRGCTEGPVPEKTLHLDII